MRTTIATRNSTTTGTTRCAVYMRSGTCHANTYAPPLGAVSTYKWRRLTAPCPRRRASATDGTSSSVVQAASGPSYRVCTPNRSRISLARSYVGAVVATVCMYSCTTPSMEAFITGPRYRRKNPTTSASSKTAIASIVATSLVKTDRRTRSRRARSRIAVSGKPISGSAHGSDESGALGIVAELLPEATHKDIDRAIIGIQIDPMGLVQNAIATQDPSAVPHEHAEQLEFGRRQ